MLTKKSILSCTLTTACYSALEFSRTPHHILVLKCGSRKYPYPPPGWSLEILRGWRVSKAKIFKGK